MGDVQRNMEHRGSAAPTPTFGVFNPGFFQKVVEAKWAAVLVPVGIAVANLLPTGHLPGSFCPISALARLPCPTCGLLRAMVLLARLDVVGAFHYHPLVPAAWALAVGAAALEVLPARARRWATAFGWRHARGLDAIAFGGTIAAGLFGAVRLALYIARPADWSFLIPRWTLVQLFGG